MQTLHYIFSSLFFGLVVYNNNIVYGCSCYPQSTNQELYCIADFVIKMRLNNTVAVPYPFFGPTKHYINITEIFKATDDARKALESNMLLDVSGGTSCEVSLKPNGNYVIGGSIHDGKATIHLCYLLINNINQINNEYDNLRENYLKNC